MKQQKMFVVVCKKNYLLSVILLSLMLPGMILTSSKQSYVLPVDSHGYTSLHNAALNDDVHTIKALVKTYPHEINRPSEYDSVKQQTYKDTPTHLAAFHGKWNAFTTLVALGANLNVINSLNMIPADNVLKREHTKYQEALKSGIFLKSQRNKTSIAVQTDLPDNVQTLVSKSQTESGKSTSASSQTDCDNQTQKPPSYNNPPSYSATIHRLPPPPYQSDLNPAAKPFILAPSTFEARTIEFSYLQDTVCTSAVDLEQMVEQLLQDEED